MKTIRHLPDSRHFRLEQLADGVYAGIHIGGGAAIGNAGIVDLGDRTLVLDTFFAPQAAEDLRTVAEALTGRPIDAVIDSHYHNDHIGGNQVFSSDTDIISPVETRRLIIATQGLYDFQSFKSILTYMAYRCILLPTQREGERNRLLFWFISSFNSARCAFLKAVALARPESNPKHTSNW